MAVTTRPRLLGSFEDSERVLGVWFVVVNVVAVEASMWMLWMWVCHRRRERVCGGTVKDGVVVHDHVRRQQLRLGEGSSVDTDPGQELFSPAMVVRRREDGRCSSTGHVCIPIHIRMLCCLCLCVWSKGTTNSSTTTKPSCSCRRCRGR